MSAVAEVREGEGHARLRTCRTSSSPAYEAASGSGEIPEGVTKMSAHNEPLFWTDCRTEGRKVSVRRCEELRGRVAYSRQGHFSVPFVLPARVGVLDTTP